MSSSHNPNAAEPIPRPANDPEQPLDSASATMDMDRCVTLSEPLPSDIIEGTVATSRFIQLRSSKTFLSFTVGLAVFVDLLCYGIIMPLTPSIIKGLGMKSTANGALIACYAIGLLISSPVAGIISDKMANRRVPMVVGLVCLLLSTVLFMEAMKHFWLLLIARFAAGLAGGTMMTLGFALLSDTYPANQLGQEMGKVMIGQTLGLMVGPPLGGLLEEHIGVKAPYVFCIILIAIDLTARLLIIEPRSAKILAIREYQKKREKELAHQGSDVQQQLQQQQLQQQHQEQLEVNLKSKLAPPATETIAKMTTMRGLLTKKRLITALVVSFVQAFLIAALEPVLPLVLADRFNLSKTQIGVIFLAISIPSFVSPIAGWFSDKHGAKWMSAIAIGTCGVLVIVLGIPGVPLWAMILFLVGIGATCATYITPVLGEISAVVRVTGDGDGFARAFALFNMTFSLGMVAGPLLGTVIYQETSFLWTCVLIGIVTILILPLVFMFMGGKTQKLKDQAQYEKDMDEQNDVLDRIKNEQQQQHLQQNEEQQQSFELKEKTLQDSTMNV
ncbi:hypothetical protein BGZ83_001205 [Gryganskiella cystojenkinii]|nr:hypothetical protein BGZ83_001205 [Gryganskiella cystojenkinii]